MPIKYTGEDGKVEEVNINTPRGFYLYNKQRGNIPQGTNKTYWDNPARIARYYWLKKSLPEGQNAPDWMPANLDQTYNYLLNKNSGKPWYMWDDLTDDDPIVPEVRSWQAPPDYAQQVASQFHSEGRLDWRPPEMIKVNDEAAPQQYDADGNPIEVDANGAPVEQYAPDTLPDTSNNPFGYDAATWDQLEWYKKIANYAMATGSGQMALGAAQGAVPGAIAGGLPGGVIGGVIGAAAGGLGAIEQQRAQKMGENYTPGVAGKFMQGMDWLYRQSNNLLGFITQIGMSAEAPEKYGNLTDLLSNAGTNWNAGQGFYASLGVNGEYSGGAVTGEKIKLPARNVWIAMSDKERADYMAEKRAELNKGGYFEYSPMDQPGVVKVDMPAGMNPTEYGILQARDMLKSGMTTMETQNALFELYGLGGQATDLIAGLALDPLNKFGEATTGVTGRVAKAAGNVTLETAARMSNGPTDMIRNYGKLLRTKALPATPTNVEIGKMDAFTRWLANVDKEGNRTFNAGTGKKTDPRTWFGLTPRALADEYITTAATNLQIALQEADTPEGMMSITAALGNVDIDAASEITTKLPWTQSPEGAALPMALRDYISLDDLNPASSKPTSTPGGMLLDTYHKYDWQRNLINRIAADLELDPYAVMQKIATGQADAILKQEIGVLGQRAGTGDAGAKTWLDAINDEGKPPSRRKPLTGEKLGEFVDNFQKGVAFGPEEFRGQVYMSVLDHVDKWAATYFKVKPDPTLVRFSSTMKATQSLFLLGLGNINYAANNILNNYTTMMWDGIFGLRSEGQIKKFWTEIGVTPPRLHAGVGILGMGDDLKVGKAVRAASTQSGMMQKWSNIMQTGWRKKIQFTQNLSQYMEQKSSAQAFTAGTMQAMNRLMVAGVGYEKLSPVLAKQLDAITPGLSMAVESAIAGSGGNTKLLDQIWEGTERITLEQSIPDIVGELKAQGLDIDTGGVRDVLQSSGLYDFLKTELPKAKDDAAVKSTFAIADDMLQRKLDEMARVQRATRAERETINAKVSGVAGSLETYDNLHLDIREFWLRHFVDLETVFSEAENMTSVQRDAVIRAQLDVADKEWNRIRDQEYDTMTGVFRGLGGDDADIHTLERNMLNARDVWGNFYAERRRMWDEYFNAAYKDKAERSTARAKVDEALDNLYEQSLKAEEELQADTDSIFSKLFGKQFFGNGDAAAAWRKGIRDIRNVMGEEMRTFRQTLRNMEPAQKRAAWGEFLVTYKQRIAELSAANLEKARGMHQVIGGEAAKTGNVQHVIRHTIMEMRTKLALAGIGSDTHWNAQYKKLNRYLDPADPPFTEMDYNVTPTPEWMARLDKSVAKMAEAEGQPVATPKPTMPEVAQEVGAQVAAREKVKWYAGQNGVQEIDGDQVRSTLRQSWLDANYSQRDVDTVLAMMDAKAELQARRQGKTVAQWYADAWAGGTLELPDFGDPAFQTLFQTAPKVGTPEYVSFIQGSKIVDANGEPLHLYHGTGATGFEDFNTQMDSGRNLFGPGHYFTDNPEVARTYAFSGSGNTPGMYEVIGRMEKPLDLRDGDTVGRFASEVYDTMAGDNGYKFGYFGADYYRVMGELNSILYGVLKPTEHNLFTQAFQRYGAKMNRLARELGYDGIIYEGGQYYGAEGAKHTAYVFFEGEQVGNVKVDTFFQSERGKSWYYSQLQNVIETKMPNKASKEQIRGMLAGQVKSDELKWTGFDEWLDEQKGSVTKQQVMDFLQENQVEVNEKVYGLLDNIQQKHKLIRDDMASYLEAKHHMTQESAEETVYRIATGEVKADNEILALPLDRQQQALDLQETYRQLPENGGRPRYSGYVLPGGENYRELLITLPIDLNRAHELKSARINELIAHRQEIETMPAGDERARQLRNVNTQIDMVMEEPDISRRSTSYQSPHWSEPNVLSHVRFDDRVDADGKRVLFVEEIQSDWHQAGREKGYKEVVKELPPEFEVINEQGGYSVQYNGNGYTETLSVGTTKEQVIAQALVIINRKGIKGNEVPAAPFSKNWEELSIKRIIRWAAENGYERVAWTTGEMQSKRYRLGNYIDTLEYGHRIENNRWILDGKRGGESVVNRIIEDGELEGAVGVEVAKKMRALEGEPGRRSPDVDYRVLNNADISVESPGMKVFYDEKIPNIIGKYIKKWGAKVGETNIAAGKVVEVTRTDGTTFSINAKNSLEQAKSFVEQNPGYTYKVLGEETVQSFDVTPAMRESAMQGQPLFQRNAAATTFLPDGRAVFSALGTSRNITQLVHEVGHVFRRQLSTGGVDSYIKYLKREYDITVTYDPQTGRFGGEGVIGAEKAPWLEQGGTLDTATWAEEVFARGFERYLREGRAPTAALRRLFHDFRNWMMEIYRSIKGSDIDVQMTDELRGIFDRMFSEKADKRFGGAYIDDLMVEYKGDKAKLYDDLFERFHNKKAAVEAARQYEITQRPVELTATRRLVDWSAFGEALDDLEQHPELDPFEKWAGKQTKEETVDDLFKVLDGRRDELAGRMDIPQKLADGISESIKVYAQNLLDSLPASFNAVVKETNPEGGFERFVSNNPGWYSKLSEKFKAKGKTLNRKSVENALHRIIEGNGADEIKSNENTIRYVKGEIWDFMLGELNSSKPEGVELYQQLVLEPLPRDYVAQGKMKEAAQQVQKWMMTDISADLTEADWAQLVGDVDTFSKLLDYDIEADLPGDVSAQAIADVQRGKPVDVDTAARVGDKAMVLRMAQEFGIPTATKAGKPMDKAALNIINKRQPEGQKYASLSEVPADVAEQAFRDHKAKYEVVEPEPPVVEVEQVATEPDATPLAQVEPATTADSWEETRGKMTAYDRLQNPPTGGRVTNATEINANNMPQVWDYYSVEIARNDPKLSTGRAGEIAAARITREIEQKIAEVSKNRSADPNDIEWADSLLGDEENYRQKLMELSGSRTLLSDIEEEPLAKRPLSAEPLDDVYGNKPEKTIVVKQDWELTAEQYRKQYEGDETEKRATQRHRGIVQRALRDGENVPPEVLADYPDLAPSPAKATTPIEYSIPVEQIGDLLYFKGDNGDLYRAPVGSPPDDQGYPNGARWETPKHMVDSVLNMLREDAKKWASEDASPAAPAPLPGLPMKAEPTFARMKSGQTTMFGAGEDTPLFSGTPMTAKQETFAPQQTGGQDALFATGEYLKNIEAKQGGDESGLFAEQAAAAEITPKEPPRTIHGRPVLREEIITAGKNKYRISVTEMDYGFTKGGLAYSVEVKREESYGSSGRVYTMTTWEYLKEDYPNSVARRGNELVHEARGGMVNGNTLFQSTSGGKIVTEPIQPDTHGGMKIVANVYREIDGQRELIAYMPEAFSTAQWQDSSSGRFHIIGLDVNEPSKWLIEFEDGHFDTLDRNAEPAVAVNAPIGTLDQIDPNAPITGAMLEAGRTTVKPILNALQRRMTRPDATVPQKLRGVKVDDATRQQVNAHLAKVRGQMSSAKLAAVRIGETKRDFALLNYNHRTNIDTYLTAIFPYQFWGTRTMMNWALRFIDKPSIMANYARLQMMRQRNERKGIPNRLKGKIAIPMPFLPNAMGDFVFVDPQRQIFPWENFYKPLEMLSDNKNMVEKRATQIVSDWIESETISQDKGTAALKKSGPDWERAVAQANQELADDLDKPYDIMSSLFSPAKPVTDAYYYMTNQKDKIGKLPFTRLIEGLTGLAGKPVDIEGPIRKGMGIDSATNVGAFESSWQDWEIDRALSNMVGDGTIDQQTAITAMIDRKGEAYDEATKRIGKERGVRQLLPGLFADLYPEGEKNQRQLAAEYSKAIGYKKGGDTDALTKFFDAHPDYEARLASFNEPEDRLRSFLVGMVWDQYNTLGKIEKQAMSESLGELFTDAFIAKETRSYDAIDTETLASWAKTMGGKTPETAKGVTMPVNMPDQKTIEASEAYYSEKDAKFPGINEKLTAYYANENPKPNAEIDAYNSWRDHWMAKNPDLIQYLTSEENELNGLPTDISTYVYKYRAAREDNFPGIFDVQENYFAISDTQKKKAYRAAHPELEQYWAFRKDYAANYPKAASYILSDESLAGYIRGDTYSTGSEAGYATYDKPADYRAPFLGPDEIAKFEPGLIRQLYAYIYGGGTLGDGAKRELRQLKTDFGISGDLDEFIDLYVKPAIVR